MNDPGLEEPISKHAKDIENQDKDERDEMLEDEEAFLQPRCVVGEQRYELSYHTTTRAR